MLVLIDATHSICIVSLTWHLMRPEDSLYDLSSSPFTQGKQRLQTSMVLIELGSQVLV